MVLTFLEHRKQEITSLKMYTQGIMVSKCFFSTAPHIRSLRPPCLCFPKKVSLQLSSEQSVGHVSITQLDWKGFPQARSRGCKSSVAIAAECSRHHASRNVSWPQRAPSTVGHETAVVGQVERRLPGQRLANQAIGMPLWTWRALGWVANGVRVIPARYDHCVVCQYELHLAIVTTMESRCHWVWQQLYELLHCSVGY